MRSGAWLAPSVDDGNDSDRGVGKELEDVEVEGEERF